MENSPHIDSSEAHLPPGFRFHPTDEELVTYYLIKKVLDGNFTGRAIAEVDLNKCEPWELPEKAKMGEKEWYFFNVRDRKYPTGLRTNRATGCGYWKATGKDREIDSSKAGGVVGMKKTLVFYRGRAPKGEKTNWVMHEYRLDGNFSYHFLCNSSKDEWVISRVFQKTGGGGGKKGRLSLSEDHKKDDIGSPSSSYLPALLDSSPYTANAASSDREHVSCFSTIATAVFPFGSSSIINAANQSSQLTFQSANFPNLRFLLQNNEMGMYSSAGNCVEPQKHQMTAGATELDYIWT